MSKRKLCLLSITVLLFLLSFLPLAQATTYEYDELGRLQTVTYDNGQTVTYERDAGGNLLIVNAPDTFPPKIVGTDPVNGAINVPPDCLG